MFEGNPQTAGQRFQSNTAQGGVQTAAPRQVAAAPQTIDPQTQATFTAADNLERQRDYQGAANLLKQALNNNLQSADLHHRLGVNLLNLGQLEEAVSEFRIGSALNPSSKEFSEDYARALKILKKTLSQEGDLK